MREADALKGDGKKAYFPKHFYYCTKSTLPFLSQPPGNCTWCAGLRVTEGFCLAPCPQAELSAPGQHHKEASATGCQVGAGGVPTHTYSLAELGLG